MSPMPPLRTAAVLVAIFAALFGLGQFHRVSGGVMVPVFERELGLTADLLGAVIGANFLASAVALIPIGILIDRFGARRMIPATLAIGICGSVLFAMANSAATLIAARLLVGIGYAGSGIGLMVVYARWFPSDRLSAISAWTIAFGSVGGLLATTPLAYLTESVGWRVTFYGVAGLTALAAIAVAVLVRNAPADYRRSTASPATSMESLIGMREVFLQRDIYPLLAMSVVAFGPGMIVVGLWGGPYLRDVFDLGPIERGLAFFAMALASPLAIAVVGPLDRIFNTRKGVVIALAAGSVSGFVILTFFGHLSLWIAIPMMVAINACQGFYVVLAVHCRALFPDHLIGRANTTLSFVGVIAIAVMLYVSGLIVEAFPEPEIVGDATAYRVVFGTIAALMGIAIAIYSRARDVRPLV